MKNMYNSNKHISAPNVLHTDAHKYFSVDNVLANPVKAKSC